MNNIVHVYIEARPAQITEQEESLLCTFELSEQALFATLDQSEQTLNTYFNDKPGFVVHRGKSFVALYKHGTRVFIATSREDY